MAELLIIGGATATGKSHLACLVAERADGEIISADSMSVYRGMDVGTAKPRECMERIKHHLVDVVDAGEHFDAKLFEDLALRAVEEIRLKGKLPVVVGGTYLYIQALLYSIEETPEPNWKLRERLYSVVERKGSAYLYRKLRSIDPFYADRIHPNDARRVVRALEVFIETGKPFSRFHRWGKPRFRFLGVHVVRDWETLSRRIEERVRRMIEEGLVEEVRSLLERGFERFLTASQAIGYKELIPYLKGETDLESAVQEVIRNTREYAKRQIRWFRKQGWLEVNLDRLTEEEACEFILRRLGKRSGI